MRSRPAYNDNKSIKTFFIYTAIVLFFIFLSLSVRMFYLIQQSKYDGKHQIIIALVQGENVKEIVAFRPANQSVVTLKFTGTPVLFTSLGKNLGVIPDAKVLTMAQIPGDVDVRDLTQALLTHYYTIKTNLTIFDVVRLFLDSHKASFNNHITKEIIITKDVENSKEIKNTITDNTIFSENVSVQIINASSTPGLGKRLEKALTNLGANVIAISTSRKVEKLSKIKYFGNETYTLQKFKHLLHYPTEKLEKEAIADIIIFIGDDSSNTEMF